MRKHAAFLFLAIAATSAQAQGGDPRAEAMLSMLPIPGASAQFDWLGNADETANGLYTSNTAGCVFSDGIFTVTPTNYVLYSGDERSTTALTASAWVKTTNTSTMSVASCYLTVGNLRSWVLQCNGGKFQAVVSTGPTEFKVYVSTESVADGAWHHLAFTFSPNNLTMYLDGKPISPTKSVDKTVNTISIGPEFVSLGCDCYSIEQPFQGQIGRIRVFPTTFTADQIWQLYCEGAH